MLPTPRVIAIDDELKHLLGLTEGLNRYGAACLPIHFTGETENIPPCPHVRVIFADLHLTGGPATDHAKDFSMIGGLIEDSIRPSGPYLIVLWTQYPEEADRLRTYLNDLEGVTKPFAVRALDKNDHLDATNGSVKSTETLVEAIGEIVTGQPQVAALLNWEERVLDAAADTISSILKLAEPVTAGLSRNEEVGSLLASLAVESVGEEHVEEDRFRAVNEALLPILADRIASMRSREADNELWQAAFKESDIGRGLSLKKAAKLNLLLHIAVPPTDKSKGDERGTVIDLPKEFSGKAFESAFDLAQETAAHKQFWRKKETGKDDDQVRWVLVQTQAACDYAQAQPGPLPFHLGLCLPASKARKDLPPAALWRSPCFDLDGEPHFLHVNARFQVSLPNAEVAEAQPLFRLREQLLNDLVYRLHSYGARPGIISFHELKKK